MDAWHPRPMEAMPQILEAEEGVSGLAAAVYLGLFLSLPLLRLLKGVEEAVYVVVLPDELSRELRKPVEDGEGEGKEGEGEEGDLIHLSRGGSGFDAKISSPPPRVGP